MNTFFKISFSWSKFVKRPLCLRKLCLLEDPLLIRHLYMKLKSLFDCERLSLKQKPHWFKKTNKQEQYSFSPSNDILGIGLIRSVGPQKWLRSSPCCSFNSDNLMRKSYIFIIYPIFANVEIVRRCRRLAAVIAVEEQRERDDTGSRKMAESCCLSHFVFFVVFSSYISWFFTFCPNTSPRPVSSHTFSEEVCTCTLLTWSVINHSFMFFLSPHEENSINMTTSCQAKMFALWPFETEECTAAAERFLL